MSFISKFTRRDLGFAVLTGLITGTIAWRIFGFLGISEFYNIPWMLLVIIVPILWILGVLLGYFLGQWLNFFNQFGKFAAIGFTNAAVDFGVLNILIFQTGIFDGKGYSGLKSISFCIALLSSYIWNKYWAFRSEDSSTNSAPSSRGLEFGKFFLVTIIAFTINVSSASFVVNYINPLAGMDPHVWANIGAIVGSALGLVFSFVGFKLVVFKK